MATAKSAARRHSAGVRAALTRVQRETLVMGSGTEAIASSLVRRAPPVDGTEVRRLLQVCFRCSLHGVLSDQLIRVRPRRVSPREAMKKARLIALAAFVVVA